MPPAHLAYTTNLTHRHPVGAEHARPATYPIPQLVAIAQQIPNMHLAQKSLSKFVKKNRKKVLTSGSVYDTIVKLSRGGGRGKPFYQQLVRVF